MGSIIIITLECTLIDIHVAPHDEDGGYHPSVMYLMSSNLPDVTSYERDQQPIVSSSSYLHPAVTCATPSCIHPAAKA